MIRWVIGQSFQRWGLAGALCALLCIGWLGWWVASALWWLVTAQLYVLGTVAGFLYLLVLVAVVRWLRGRRRDDHLLYLGRRRRWPS